MGREQRGSHTSRNGADRGNRPQTARYILAGRPRARSLLAPKCASAVIAPSDTSRGPWRQPAKRFPSGRLELAPRKQMRARDQAHPEQDRALWQGATFPPASHGWLDTCQPLLSLTSRLLPVFARVPVWTVAFRSANTANCLSPPCFGQAALETCVDRRRLPLFESYRGSG